MLIEGAGRIDSICPARYKQGRGRGIISSQSERAPTSCGNSSRRQLEICTQAQEQEKAQCDTQGCIGSNSSDSIAAAGDLDEQQQVGRCCCQQSDIMALTSKH